MTSMCWRIINPQKLLCYVEKNAWHLGVINNTTQHCFHIKKILIYLFVIKNKKIQYNYDDKHQWCDYYF